MGSQMETAISAPGLTSDQKEKVQQNLYAMKTMQASGAKPDMARFAAMMQAAGQQ
eukprot:NODE_6831_length_342_cov_41.040956_g6104_i0.p3 GENE.NODE_6831_length_342_cov_41.040956_g6104_i0~~NODE_6831_length_342_cov_41.040956_g6104_i0.p3  ORF type:complete len:55 (-),score=12.00 NODE_6831_length_342_cov_41.040956_g6104_i0:150-314(-)